MLRIYPVAIELVKEVSAMCEVIAMHDRDHARQLRWASMSIVLNIGEGSGSGGGTRRARYENALGSAKETLCGLEAAVAIGYGPGIQQPTRNRFDHIIGVLTKLTRRR